MKIAEEHIIRIRNSFENMQTKEDLLQLLNEVKPLLYGEKSVPFELKQLTWYANSRTERKRYKEFTVKKKSGGDRIINAPVQGLKAIQKVLGFILQCVFEPHKAAMGFTWGRSVADNARIHTGRNYVYNIDLKDFFPSIDQARVWKCLQLKPFSLSREFTQPVKYMDWKHFKHKYLQTDAPIPFTIAKDRMYTETPLGMLYTAKDFDKEKDKYVLLGSRSLKTKSGKPLKGTLWLTNNVPDVNRLEIANVIAAICCTEMEVERKNENNEWVKVKRNVLPQGAPTSPVITNMVCQRLDFLFTGVAKRFGLKYSRYADDITFSSMHNVFQPESDFLKEIHRIISEQGFHINESKTRLQKRGYRQEVTGLLVNEKANVQKRYIKQIRMWLYYWERYGYEKASAFFLKQYKTEKGQVKKGMPDMANVIGGKLDYLKMVKGGENELFLKLQGRFDKLTCKTELRRSRCIELVKDNNKQCNSLSINMMEQRESEITTNKTPIRKIVNNRKINPIIHYPAELVKLLGKFSEDKHPLKYTKHSWGSGLIEGLYEDYFDFISKYNEKGRPICFQIRVMKKELGQKILNFTNTENEGGYYLIKNGEKKRYFWGEYQIPLGWKSKELSDWAYKKKETDPFDFEIDPAIKIEKHGKLMTLTHFRDIVNVFTNEIEIRPEGNQLETIMIEMKRKYLRSDFKKPNYIDLKGKQFYTDVHYFKKALNKVFEAISRRTMFPQIDISATNVLEGTYTTVSIVQHGSYCKDKTSDEMIEEVKDGDFADIKNYLENLCDWSIETIFSDGPFRINYLVSDEKVLSKLILNENQPGFKHEFKFYK